MANQDYEIKQLNDLIDGEQKVILPISVFDAIMSSVGEDAESLSKVLKDITPVNLTRADYERMLENGEITDDDMTYYYVPDGETTRFEINDKTITKKTTFSSQKLAEIFASVGISTNASQSTIKASVEKKTVSLSAGNWSNGSYKVALSGVTTKSMIHIEINNALDNAVYDAQYNAYKNADIRRIKKSENTIELLAYGTIPSIDIMIDVAILQRRNITQKMKEGVNDG